MSRKCTNKSKYGKNCEIVESDSDSESDGDSFRNDSPDVLIYLFNRKKGMSARMGSKH